MLGFCLLFVGIVLINTGACTLMKVPPKAAAVMNIFVGGLSLFTDLLKKNLGKFVPCLQIFEGVVTAWIPGVMMLFGVW